MLESLMVPLLKQPASKLYYFFLYLKKLILTSSFKENKPPLV